MKKEYRIKTGEYLTEEQLEYWYKQDMDGMTEYVKNQVSMSADSNMIVYGIPVILLQNFINLDMEVSVRTLIAIKSAQEIYYSIFVVKQLVHKNLENVKISKLKVKNLKRAQMKLVKRINN